MGSIDTPTPTPPSPLEGQEGTATGGGGGDNYEDVSSIDIMCTLIKARHWLFDNAEEAWIMEDDKSIVTTSLTSLIAEAARCGAINWPVEQLIQTV